MADATFAAEGYEEMLLALIEGADWYCHLYTNDPAVDATLTAAALTEPAYVGYKPQPLALWTPPTLRGPTAFSVHDIVEWRWTEGAAPAPIRGYFVTHGASGRLAWARRSPGDAYALGPGAPLLLLYLRLDFPPG